MKRLIPVFLMLILMSAPVYAVAFQDGMDSYNRGDYKTAFELWKPFAEKGDAKAQFALGRLYDIGQGVALDYIQAYKWLSIAGSKGYEKARKNRAKIEKQMTPTQIAEAQKLAREWME